MRQSLKQWVTVTLAAATALAVIMPTYAAEDREKIESVRLEVEWDGEPVAGEDIGSVDVKISDTAHYIKTECYYKNEDDDTWTRGETPIVRVELEAKEGYRFYSTSKTKFRISGCHSEFKSAKIMESGNAIQIDIKLRKVGGDLQDVDELYWDGRTARWDEVEDADKYEVKLYRGSSTVTTVTTTTNSYNFSTSMTKAGDYNFKVRAISNSDGEKSAWTETSDDYYVDKDSVYNGSGSAWTPGGNQGGPETGGATGGAGWVQYLNNWYYFMPDGNFIRNNWYFVDNNWFYFDANGFMATGWIFVDNNWFYMNPVSNGTRGAMMTGWQFIDGYWYYLNPISDGTRGARKSSYQLIDGNWYFFDLNSGAMWTNMMTPNGKWIDGTGIVH